MPQGKRINGAPDLKMSQHPTALTIKKAVRAFGYYSYIGPYRTRANTRLEGNPGDGNPEVGAG
jgi:hypothetical protein